MPRPLPILALLSLLCACASAPAPVANTLPPEVAGPTERYGPQIEAQAMALIAAEPPGAVPAGLRVAILSVEETPGGLFYNAQLSVPAKRKADRDYVIYGRCQTSDLADCARQIVSGARMLPD